MLDAIVTFQDGAVLQLTHNLSHRLRTYRTPTAFSYCFFMYILGNLPVILLADNLSEL